MNCLNFDGITVKSPSIVKLLGVLLDCTLNFSAHVKSLFVNWPLRVRPFPNNSCGVFVQHISYQYSITAQSIGCLESKTNNGLINKVQRRALRAIYEDLLSLSSNYFWKGKNVFRFMFKINGL